MYLCGGRLGWPRGPQLDRVLRHGQAQVVQDQVRLRHRLHQSGRHRLRQVHLPGRPEEPGDQVALALLVSQVRAGDEHVSSHSRAQQWPFAERPCALHSARSGFCWRHWRHWRQQQQQQQHAFRLRRLRSDQVSQLVRGVQRTREHVDHFGQHVRAEARLRRGRAPRHPADLGRRRHQRRSVAAQCRDLRCADQAVDAWARAQRRSHQRCH